jgi:hypothetical protein
MSERRDFRLANRRLRPLGHLIRASGSIPSATTLYNGNARFAKRLKATRAQTVARSALNVNYAECLLCRRLTPCFGHSVDGLGPLWHFERFAQN